MPVRNALQALSDSQRMDVEMPDGTIIENVPKGTKKADIERRWRKARDAGKIEDKRPTSFWQGVREELGRAASNAQWAGDILQGKGVVRALTGQPAPSDVTRSQVRNQARNASVRGSTAGKITGGVLGTIPTAMVPGGPFAQGVAAGALLTKDPNDVKGLARDVTIGGVAGKAGDLVGRKVLAPAAERIGRTKPVRAAAEAVARAVNRKPLPLPKITKPERMLSRAAANAVDDVRTNIDDAARLGLPYSLADADPRLRALGGSVARFSPDARAMAERNLTGRNEDRAFRAIAAIDDYLSPPNDIKQVGQALKDTAQRKSGPLYEKAFEGGSIAPLKSQLDDAFNASSKAVAAANAELAAAKRGLTLSRAAVSRAGNNVYQNAKALPADRQAQAAVAAAEKKLASAQVAHQQVLSVLRRAQEDAASNAPGAVWSPRVQQFLDDPIAKQGLARGIEIQRLEALAAGKPFNPTEYAVTAVDEAGNPVVSSVPNMRTLNAVKKGLDAIIDDYPKDFKGKPILDERGRAVTQVLKSFRQTLDDINPDYKDARAAYQKYARMGEALDRGYASTGRNVMDRDLGKITAGYSPKELAQFRSGYATSLRDQVAKGSDGTNPYKTIFSGIERPSKIGSLFPRGSKNFARQAELEGEMAKTLAETIGGSQTQPRAVADSMFQTGIASDLVDAGIQASTGGGVPGLTRLAGAAARSIKDMSQLGLLGAKKKADALGPLLFDTSNPRGLLDILDEIARKRTEEELRKRAYQQSLGLLSIPAAGVAAATAP